MNANEIVENKVSGINLQLDPSWGQDEDIYTLKNDRLSGPRVLLLDIQQGLLVTGHLIGGLCGCIVWVNFFWDVVTSLTIAARL